MLDSIDSARVAATAEKAAADARKKNLDLGMNIFVQKLLAGRFSEKGSPVQNVTTAERDAEINPPVGRQVFNTTTNSLQIYNGSWWQEAGIAMIGVMAPSFESGWSGGVTHLVSSGDYGVGIIYGTVTGGTGIAFYISAIDGSVYTREYLAVGSPIGTAYKTTDPYTVYPCIMLGNYVLFPGLPEGVTAYFSIQYIHGVM